MKTNGKFKSLDAKLRMEAIIRSAVWGMASGALAAFICAFVCWFLAFHGLVVSIVAFVFGSAVAGVLFYYGRFRPSVQSNARRLDRCGLEERVITMVELEGQDSYIARRQREDAAEKLAAIDPSYIKFRISRSAIVLSVAVTLIFAGMATVESLSGVGVLPTGIQVWYQVFPPEPLPVYNLSYGVNKGGYLVGQDKQVVTQGDNAEMVLAVADDGFMFYAWSDGVTTPYRTESNVQKHLSVNALFIEVKNLENVGGDKDAPDDVPGDEGGQGGDESSDGSTGKYTEVNQVIDGETYYRDVFEEYYNMAMEYINKGEAIPEEIRSIIEAYYNIIQ